jgi:hypothetical protein
MSRSINCCLCLLLQQHLSLLMITQLAASFHDGLALHTSSVSHFRAPNKTHIKNYTLQFLKLDNSIFAVACLFQACVELYICAVVECDDLKLQLLAQRDLTRRNDIDVRKCTIEDRNNELD